MASTTLATSNTHVSGVSVSLVRLHNSGSYALVAGTEQVARLHVHPRVFNEHRYPEIEVYVHEEYRGQGYGRLGLQMLSDHLLSERFPTVIGVIHKSSEAALHNAFTAGFHIMHDFGKAVIVARSC